MNSLSKYFERINKKKLPFPEEILKIISKEINKKDRNLYSYILKFMHLRIEHEDKYVNENLEKYEKIYAISDLHADYSTFYKRLIDFGLIEAPKENLTKPEKELTNTEKVEEIYKISKLYDFTWLKQNTILVICGDIIDGRRKVPDKVVKEVYDPKGFFELYLHIFLKNLKAKALEHNSDVICVLGNHDVMMFPENQGNYNAYVHRSARDFYGSQEVRRNLLAPFYLNNFYFQYVLKSKNEPQKFVFAHASLHKDEDWKYLDDENKTDTHTKFFTTMKDAFILGRTVHDSLGPHDSTYKINTFYEYNNEEDTVVWDKRYANIDIKQDDKLKCKKFPDNTTVIVGHCTCDMHKYFFDRPCQQNDSCIYSKCSELINGNSNKYYPKLIMIDTRMSNCFRGDLGMTEPIEILEITKGESKYMPFEKFSSIYFNGKTLEEYDLMDSRGLETKYSKYIEKIGELTDDDLMYADSLTFYNKGKKIVSTKDEDNKILIATTADEIKQNNPDKGLVITSTYKPINATRECDKKQKMIQSKGSSEFSAQTEGHSDNPVNGINSASGGKRRTKRIRWQTKKHKHKKKSHVRRRKKCKNFKYLTKHRPIHRKQNCSRQTIKISYGKHKTGPNR